MSLSASQQKNALAIYTEALSFGLPPDRAVELVGVSYAESGLDATNYYGKSRGDPWQGEGRQAAGLFQLLSGGYIAKAEAIGKKRGDAPGTAVFDPIANIEAIMPSYRAYFHSNPHAVAGAAGSAVEASGESASWYAGGESGYLKAAGYKSVQDAVKSLGGASGGVAKEQVTAGSVPGVNAAGNAVKGIVGSVTSIEDAVKFLFSYRGLEVIGGGLLIIVGLVGLMREVGVMFPSNPVTQAADNATVDITPQQRGQMAVDAQHNAARARGDEGVRVVRKKEES